MNDKTRDNLTTQQKLGKQIANYLEKNEGINVNKLYQSIFDNVKNLNDAQTKEIVEEIESFLQPASSGGKRRTKRKSRKSQKTKRKSRKSRKPKKKTMRTKRKSRKYLGGAGDDETCPICYEAFNEEQIRNSISLEDLPNINIPNNLPDNEKPIVRHTIVTELGPTSHYFHGRCLYNWYKSRPIMSQMNNQINCITCQNPLNSNVVPAILEKFATEDDDDDDDDVNYNQLQRQFNLAIHEFDEFRNNLFLNERGPTPEDNRELQRRGLQILNLGILIRRHDLNRTTFRRYLYLFIRATSVGYFYFYPNEEFALINNIETMSERHAFIIIVIGISMSLMFWIAWLANRMRGGAGEINETLKEKNLLDLLLKILKKLIEYNKRGNSEEIEKLVIFLKNMKNMKNMKNNKII